ECGARIDARSDGATQAQALQSGGFGQRAVAPQEFLAVGGVGTRANVDIRKGDGKVRALCKRVAREQRAALLIQFGYDLKRRVVPDAPQHPCRIKGGSQATWLIAEVADLEADELHRLVG